MPTSLLSTPSHFPTNLIAVVLELPFDYFDCPPQTNNLTETYAHNASKRGIASLTYSVESALACHR